jgi:hypothetical protein
MTPVGGLIMSYSKSLYKKKVIDSFLIIVILVNLTSFNSLAAEPSFYSFVKYEVYSKIIPELESKASKKLSQTIQNTKVTLLDGGTLGDAYAHMTKNGPEVVISSNLLYFLYLQLLGQMSTPYLSSLPNYKGDVVKDFLYYERYLFDHLDEHIKKINRGVVANSVPMPIYDFLGYSKKEYFDTIELANGGLAQYSSVFDITFTEMIASILAHEFSHVRHGHILVSNKDITGYQSRKMEWVADNESISLIAKISGDPGSAIMTNLVFMVIENPYIPSTHPTSVCRVIYTTDATIFYAYNNFEKMKRQGLTEPLLSNLKSSIDLMKKKYLKSKSKINVGKLCDDFVTLKY